MWLVALLVAGAFGLGKLALGHWIPYAGLVLGLVGVVFGLGLRSARAAALVGLAGFAAAVLLLADMPAIDDCVVHPDVTGASHCTQKQVDANADTRRGYKLDIGTMLALGLASAVALGAIRRRRPGS